MITRPRLHVEVRKLSPPEAVFGRCLLSGEDVAAAIERASRSADGFDVTAAFRELLVAGAFEQLRSLPEPTKRHNDRS